VPQTLCWTCASAEGYLAGAQIGSILGTTYQLDKFVKHTQPKWVVSGRHSVFADPSTAAYASYIVHSAASGSVSIDHRGPTFVWYAGKTIGATYIDGVYQFPNDAVKLVLPYSAPKVHAYSVSTTGFTAARCVKCSRPILSQ